ncbi:hypothetical protein HDU76_010449 [Blyttiomyces sp. JEL0837]|nr:hypothetical protein HDU76_010449 [Blyttiomyces sp. JEL0837]
MRLVTALFNVAPLLEIIANLCKEFNVCEDQVYDRTTKIYRKLGKNEPPKFEQMIAHDDALRRIVCFPRVIVCKPSSYAGLLKAIQCILDALTITHAKGLIHRDIRWANIGRSRDNEGDQNAMWYLFDFDEACGGCELSFEEHAPEVNSPDCGHACDIWGVGNLILTLVEQSGMNISSELTELATRCCNEDPFSRPNLDELKLEIQKHWESLVQSGSG